MAEGVYIVTGKRIVVTELPPGRWTQDYKEHLDDLTEKKIITGYKNSSTTETVHFEIEGYEGTELIKDFKLRKAFRTSNMHLFHPLSGIKKYSSPEEILGDFFEIRLEYYAKRKEHLIRVLTEKTLVLETKVS
jgi:DNA topoisomerase-2